MKKDNEPAANNFRPNQTESDIESEPSTISDGQGISMMPYIYNVNSNYRVLKQKFPVECNSDLDEFFDLLTDSTPYKKIPVFYIDFQRKNPFIFFSSRTHRIGGGPLGSRFGDLNQDFVKTDGNFLKEKENKVEFMSEAGLGKDLDFSEKIVRLEVNLAVFIL